MDWNGTERNGMEWDGMEWDGVEWNGMEWNGMERNGTKRNGMGRNRMDRNGMAWNGTEWNGTERGRMEWNKKAPDIIESCGDSCINRYDREMEGQLRDAWFAKGINSFPQFRKMRGCSGYFWPEEMQ